MLEDWLILWDHWLVTRAYKIRPESVIWFLKSVQKVSHYSDLLIVSAPVHFCISFPIWVFSRSELECLPHMVTPALWCHCPQLPWWILLIEEVSELRTINRQGPRRVFSLVKHPSLSCYHQCTFWSHQRFFHWDNPCTAVYCLPCKPTWKQDQPCHQHEDILKFIAQYSKATKNVIWCDAYSPQNVCKTPYFLALFLKLFLFPRLVFLKDLTYLGALYCGMLLMNVIALFLRGLWHVIKQDVTIL